MISINMFKFVNVSMRQLIFRMFVFLALFLLATASAPLANAQNLRPLLRTTYYSVSGRSFSYSTQILPRRFKPGSQIKWTITGNGLLRQSFPQSSPYGTSFTQTLGSDRVPRAVLKSTGSGLIKIKIYGVSGSDAGKLIFKRLHTFFIIEKLEEYQLKANHIPIPKPSTKWYLVAPRKANTIFLATEPDGDIAGLNLKTDLVKVVGSPKYEWSIYRRNEASGPLTYVDSGPIMANGSAYVSFSPTHTIYYPWADTDPYYCLFVGADGNGDGKVSQAELSTSSPACNLIVINNASYSSNRIIIKKAAFTGKKPTPFGSFLLYTFLEGIRKGNRYPYDRKIYANGDVAMKKEMAVIQSSVAALDSRLTHVAGARFDDNSGWAGVYRFVFTPNSFPAKLIYKSTVFRVFLTKKSRLAQSTAYGFPDSDNLYKIGPSSTWNPTPGTSIDGSTQLFRPKWEGIGFGGLPDREHLLDPTYKRYPFADLDLNIAINNAMISGQYTAYVRKHNGVATTEYIDFDGVVEDIYDFSYRTTAPAPAAAALQMGWRADSPFAYPSDTEAMRSSGKIWITEVKLKCRIHGPF